MAAFELLPAPLPITAKVPRTRCEEHGVHPVNTPWAREGSQFTLLFEQALLTLVREMPVKTCAKYVGVNDKRVDRLPEPGGLPARMITCTMRQTPERLQIAVTPWWTPKYPQWHALWRWDRQV